MAGDIPCPDWQPVLDAHIDGELPTDEAQRAQTHLAQCTKCSTWFGSQRQMTTLLRNALVQYPAPDVLKARIRTSVLQANLDPKTSNPPYWSRKGMRWGVAAAVLVLTNAATFAIARGRASDRATTDVMVASHVRSLLPGHLVDVASTDQHNVKPWFNGRAPLSPPVPSLEDRDFHLVGGRLDYVDDRSAAVVVYSRRQHMINVYALPSTADNASESATTRRGFNIIGWRAGGLELRAVSDLNAKELAEFVHVYRAAAGAP